MSANTRACIVQQCKRFLSMAFLFLSALLKDLEESSAVVEVVVVVVEEATALESEALSSCLPPSPVWPLAPMLSDVAEVFEAREVALVEWARELFSDEEAGSSPTTKE